MNPAECAITDDTLILHSHPLLHSQYSAQEREPAFNNYNKNYDY